MYLLQPLFQCRLLLLQCFLFPAEGGAVLPAPLVGAKAVEARPLDNGGVVLIGPVQIGWFVNWAVSYAEYRTGKWRKIYGQEATPAR